MCAQECDCGCRKIIVQCGPGGEAPPPPPPPTTVPPPRYSCINGECVLDAVGAYTSLGACREACRTAPPPPPPPSTPFCAATLVRIDSVSVGVSGAGPDPGPDAEWLLTIVVNGQSRTWSQDVRDNQNYSIGFDFIVSLANASSTIRVSSSGQEDDDSSANDNLPSAEQTHGSFDNWGIGGTRQLSASNSDFSYTINYTVTCLAQAAQSAISRDEAVRFVQARLTSRGVEKLPSDDELLTIFIRKVSAKGLQLRQIDSGLLLWEGALPVHRLARAVFPPERVA